MMEQQSNQPEIAGLSTDVLCTQCDETQFTFQTTAELTPGEEELAQGRAQEAIEFALGMRIPHYNIYVAGPRGSGRHRLVEKLLHDDARGRPPAVDWCYVNNFNNAQSPNAISLPTGRGTEFHAAMEQLVRDLQSALTGAFSSEEYRNAAQSLQDEFEQRQGEVLDTIRQKAESMGYAMLHTPMGYGFAPLDEGKVMPPENFNALPQAQRQKIEEDIRSLQEDLRTAMQNVPVMLQETRKKVRALNEETAELAVGHLLSDLKRKFGDLEEVLEYLDQLHADVTANVDLFLSTPGPGEGRGPQLAQPGRNPEASFFRRYQVNLLVGHEPENAAPVIFEDEPTFERLIGRIEHMAEMGTLTTDFNLIRGGALHRANGGYLILDARRVLTQPLAWEALKRALQAGEIRIEPMYSALGLPTTTTLEPEPIPLEVKVILVGESLYYHLLHAYDPDFSKLFRVLADFDERVDRTAESMMQLANLVAREIGKGGLAPFSRSGVARLIDDLARAIGDSEKLATNIDRLNELMREAAYLAGKAGKSVVEGDDVLKAIDARTRRNSRIAERMQEAAMRNTVKIATDGAAIGQINGLSVYSLGAASFGKPSRITARVRIGQGKFIDIEREVALGGPLHSKGVLILSGYLGAHYAQDTPLSLTASLVFEQSYGGVDGDSASSAELYALLSALADVPLRQDLAVTGSVNQNGEVQAIGGVNEKIEGFFDLCAARGLTGAQGVLIPEANIKHLMLHERVVEAARNGQFHIYPVRTIDEGLGILTGMAAGVKGEDGAFPQGTFNARVVEQLNRYAERRRQFGRGPGSGDNDDGTSADDGGGDPS